MMNASGERCQFSGRTNIGMGEVQLVFVIIGSILGTLILIGLVVAFLVKR